MSSVRLLAAVALACIAAVAAALTSQHVFDMQPCPWCVLQRLIFVAIALACGAVLGMVLADAGVAAALWQHFKASASASCNLTLADKIVSRWLRLDQVLPGVFEARASCADAAVSLLGVPYDVWSLVLFALIGLALVPVILRPAT
jgi:protein dithiol:quinone oxidoreductase